MSVRDVVGGWLDWLADELAIRTGGNGLSDAVDDATAAPGEIAWDLGGGGDAEAAAAHVDGWDL